LRRAIVIAIILAGLGGLAYWLIARGGQEAPNTLRLSGHIETREIDLAFRVPGTISTIYFHEGDEIRAGQVVATLEARDLKDDIMQAQAAAATARANLAKLLAGSRPQEIREAQAAQAQAKADLDNKRLDWERNEQLFKEGVIAASRRDSFRAAYQVAQQAFQQAKERARLVEIGPRREDIDAARAELARTEANLALTRTRLGYATLYASTNGVVLVRESDPGEVVAVGSPVMTTGNLDDLYVEAYIPETDLARVRYGMKAAVTTDTYPGKRYNGVVRFVESRAQFTPKTVETRQERVSLVYRTKIYVENPHHELKPGMPAEAVIFLDSAGR